MKKKTWIEHQAIIAFGTTVFVIDAFKTDCSRAFLRKSFIPANTIFLNYLSPQCDVSKCILLFAMKQRSILFAKLEIYFYNKSIFLSQRIALSYLQLTPDALLQRSQENVTFDFNSGDTVGIINGIINGIHRILMFDINF